VFEVIHNATHPVGSAKTFRKAQAILTAKAAECETALRAEFPGAEIRVASNRDSAYVDLTDGETVQRREFYQIEEHR
jgi:hypothetical protein